MTNLDILLPFSLLPPEHAKDLTAALKVPAFSRLLARAKLQQRIYDTGFAPALPHEHWLAGEKNNSPAIAAAVASQLGLHIDTGYWFLLQPASLHIARDHLVLTDLRELHASDVESRALFAAAEPLFAETGHTLLYGNAGTWLVRADDWHTLRTCTPDATCGHNIDVWQPRGEGERAWRKLHNELQMLWHTHPVNDEREVRGAQRINSAWLWGGATADQGRAHAGNQLLAKLALHTAAPSAWQDLQSDDTVIVLDQLSQPALAGDWSRWLHHFAELENHWFMPLAAAIDTGRLGTLTVILTDSSHLLRCDVNRMSMRKFWLKPSLARLHP